MPPKTKLSHKQRLFALHYVRLGGNGTRAVLASGYNQTENAAGVTAHQLLRNPKITNEITKTMTKSKMSANDVIETLTEVANEKTEIDGAQKLKALELLGKFHKLFTDKVETSQGEPDIALALVDKIQACAQKTGVSGEVAACRLYDSLADWGSVHADPANFGPYREVVENHAKSMQTQEVSDLEQ